MRTPLVMLVLGTVVHAGAVDKDCAYDWNKFNDSCYTYRGYAPWEGAAAVCAGEGADIIGCHSTEELDFIQNMAASYQNTMELWLNAKDEVSEGTWVWQDSNQTVTWGNWHNGTTTQPDGGRTENCLSMSPRAGHSWWDKPCAKRLSVYCVKPTAENVCAEKDKKELLDLSSNYKEYKLRGPAVRGSIKSLALKSSINNSNCTNDSFGFNYLNLWVDDACQGVLELCYVKGDRGPPMTTEAPTTTEGPTSKASPLSTCWIIIIILSTMMFILLLVLAFVILYYEYYKRRKKKMQKDPKEKQIGLKHVKQSKSKIYFKFLINEKPFSFIPPITPEGLNKSSPKTTKEINNQTSKHQQRQKHDNQKASPNIPNIQTHQAKKPPPPQHNNQQPLHSHVIISINEQSSLSTVSKPTAVPAPSKYRLQLPKKSAPQKPAVITNYPQQTHLSSGRAAPPRPKQKLSTSGKVVATSMRMYGEVKGRSPTSSSRSSTTTSSKERSRFMINKFLS